MHKKTRQHIESMMDSATMSAAFNEDISAKAIVEALNAQTATLIQIEDVLVKTANVLVDIANSQPPRGRVN